MNPELCEPLLEALFAAGAVDAWFTPIVMKKSRPALTVAALCAPAARDAVAAAILRESTTIGVRFSTRQRTILPRHFVEVDTPWGKVPVKVAGDGDAANAVPRVRGVPPAGRLRRRPRQTGLSRGTGCILPSLIH